MVKKILTDAGFVENVTFKESRFLKPPRETFAVFLDAVNRRGADDINLITEHDVTIELYAYSPDSESEKRIEKAFDKFGIPYTKDPRVWIQTEQLFQTIYVFDYVEK